MSARKPASRKQDDEGFDTQSLLMRAAPKVFAKRGFGGATVKEIAEEAGVNISLISYHFQGKEGLFRACLEKFGKERLADSLSILTPPESLEDIRAKLKLFAHQFLLCHVEEIDVCLIIDRENLLEMDIVKDVFENTFLKNFEAMVKFFQSAKKDGLLAKEIDPRILAGQFYGTLIHTGRTQEIQKGLFGKSIADEKFRETVIEQFVNVLLKGAAQS